MQSVKLTTTGRRATSVTVIPHPDSQAARGEPAKVLMEGDDAHEIAIGDSTTLILRELSDEETKAEQKRREPPPEDDEAPARDGVSDPRSVKND